jgi:GT2 family glycosyltransferase
MDDQFFMYGEETDWCYRFKQANWKVMFVPHSQIMHLGGCSTKQNKRRMVLQLRASILLFFKKHQTRLSYTLACLLTSLFFISRLPYWVARAVFSGTMQKTNRQTASAYGSGAIRALRGWQALCSGDDLSNESVGEPGYVSQTVNDKGKARAPL